MPLMQIILLAFIQGFTEFLPISSSGHLAIMTDLTGWTDQGLTMDVMMHVGSLGAILAYFWRDVVRLLSGVLNLLRGRFTDDGRLALYIVLATIPAVLFGVFLKKVGYLDALRADDHAKLLVVGWGAIIYGTLLYVADRVGPSLRSIEDMKLPPAMLIGIAQMFALVPGTSRSGITMTAARFLGFTRPEAARFSFLLGMPAIAGAGLLTFKDAMEEGITLSGDVWLGAILSFVFSFAAIAVLMALVKRISFLPFTLYRIALGVLLIAMAQGYVVLH
jgi:undecaprenyl-diphosphatase